MSTTTSLAPAILLKPRLYASHSGSFMLLPLLPKPKKLRSLPSEIWTQIFQFCLEAENGVAQLWSVVRVCKSFEASALALAYQRVHIHSLSQLEMFFRRLHLAEQKWDSIRRIPYSAPGRWVQTLDLSHIPCIDHALFLLDSVLTALFPLVPCLAHLSMNPQFVMSRRAIASLANRPGVVNIRSLEGISYVRTSFQGAEESMVALLRRCKNLEELDITGRSPDPSDLDWTEFEDPDAYPQSVPLSLPHLHGLTLLSIHSSPLLYALLASYLPSLEKLTITPYDDIPSSPVSKFIEIHGAGLRSLVLITPKSWPTRLHPSPTTLLQTSPKLRHLSAEHPLPTLRVDEEHPLQFLSIPRPTGESWELLVRILPHLPNLCAVRARDVRWLRGLNARAQESGVQGTMREWKKRLARRGVRMLDTDWKDIELK